MAKEVGKSQELVLRAITDLYEHSQYASRVRVIELTHLTFNQVDEAVKALREKNLVRTTTPGYFEPIDQTIDRAISATFAGMGRVKLEIGDEQLLELTPREWLQIAKLSAGALLSFARQ